MVRKADGYLIGSDTNSRVSIRIYFYKLTDDIFLQYRIQVLGRRLRDIRNIEITPRNMEEVKSALDTLYKFQKKT